MRDRESAWLSGALGALCLAAAAVAAGYPAAARRFPLAVSLLGAAFCAVQLVRDARPAPVAAPAQGRTPLADELAGLAWFVGFVAAAVLFGVVPGGALMLLLFLRVRGGESWPAAALWSVGCAGAIHLFFERMLGAAFFPGALAVWLAGRT
jgi:hypothetical protein